jgi:hypothetical protein
MQGNNVSGPDPVFEKGTKGEYKLGTLDDRTTTICRLKMEEAGPSTKYFYV